MSVPALSREAVEASVDALSALIALPVDPACRADVAGHFARLLSVAALVEEFPLADDLEVAPVFQP